MNMYVGLCIYKQHNIHARRVYIFAVNKQLYICVCAYISRYVSCFNMHYYIYQSARLRNIRFEKRRIERIRHLNLLILHCPNDKKGTNRPRRHHQLLNIKELFRFKPSGRSCVQQTVRQKGHGLTLRTLNKVTRARCLWSAVV